MKKLPSHLVIGDSHAKPGVSNSRFTLLGKLAVARKPEVIIDMGDWNDMPSLCSYDKGQKSFEGRRYLADIEAGRDARAKFAAPIAEYNRKNPDKLYNPRLVALGGNHDEGRINRLCQMQPELDGVVSVKDLGHADFGWEYIPFLTPKTIDGITYNHYFISGAKGLPIGGLHPAAALLSKLHQSVTVAHSHYFDYAMQTCANGKKIIGLVAGCWFEHHERYAGSANSLWWRGVCFANNIKDGFYDIETMRYQTVESLYG